MKYFFSFLFAIGCIYMHAQNPDLKRTNHWYFGARAGLDFSNGSPVPDTLGQLGTLEGTAAISDTAGNLLAYFGFGTYTAQWCVFNRNHQPMLNGCGIGPAGVSTPRDCAVFVPKPDDDSTYYLFTVDGWENQFQRGLRWHEIDMRQDNGLGAVVSNDNLLYAPVTEQLAATRHANGCDYWVVTHERSSDKFLAFKVTADGVDSVPVVSAVGQNYGITQQFHINNGGYRIIFSPNGDKAAIVIHWFFVNTGIPEQVQLTDFNRQNGVFFNAFDLPIDTSLGGVFFSPDGMKLYIETSYSQPSRLYQFDLTSGINTVIQQSKITVLTIPIAISADGQIGNDGKIYLTSEWDYITSTPNPHFLSVIEFPNISGTGCNIQYGAQPLGSGRATQKLPNFVSNFLVDVASAPCQYTFVYEENRNEPENILVYPNPADDKINISSNNLQTSNVTVRIIDITGRAWLEKIMKLEENEFALDVSQIPNGFYLLELHTAKSRKAFRIFIVHL